MSKAISPNHREIISAQSSITGQQEYLTSTNRKLDVNAGVSAIVPFAYDTILADYPTTNTEVYTYYTGGSGGTLVATVTVTYTDSTKEMLTSVERT